MAQDDQGNLKPLMLSELIAIAQKALATHGDMPVGVCTCVPGYDDNEEHNLPVSDPPCVEHMRWMSSYWIDRNYKKAFSISGA